jgi:hypothetical protein
MSFFEELIFDSRWFLSLPEWQVIARMGLSIYLVHVIYQLVTMMNQKQPLYFEFTSMVSKKALRSFRVSNHFIFQLHTYFGDIFATIAISIVFYLAFEVPFLIIEGYFYEKLRRSKAV